jgi:hypothetical protein
LRKEAFVKTKGILLLTLASTSLLAAHALADDYRVPRLPDGTPDLQGVWTNATATPMERAPELGERRAFTEQEAAAISKAAIAAVEADAAPSDPNRKIEAISSLPPVGNYNLFWTDRGMTVANINGEWRTSMIIEPANGRIPALTAGWPAAHVGARGARSERRSRRSAPRRALPAVVRFAVGTADDCRPMYNSYYQIVQSPGYVMILVRDGARRSHHPEFRSATRLSGIRKWMGDSDRSLGRRHARWIETRNFRPEQSFRGSSENAGRDRALHARSPKDKISLSLHRRRSDDVHVVVHG